jgi:hypothetical protein
MRKSILARAARLAVAAACVVLLSPARPAAAQQIPALATLSDTVAAAHPELVKWRADLVEDRNALRTKTQAHNSQCSAVEEGSSLAATCQQELASLKTEIGSHIDESNQFNAAAHAAETAMTSSVRIGASAALRGEVYYLTADGQKVPIQAGSPIFLNQHVITGATGHMQILLLDETVFTLGPNSDMVLDDFVYDPALDLHTIMANFTKGVFRLVTGKTAHKDPASMKVNLPEGTLGIRGTDFEATVREDGSGVVKLTSGQLQITEAKTGRIFLLNAGETVTIGSDGIFGPPNQMQ